MDLCNINVIRALLEGHGFRFSKAMGQNFLTEAWVPQKIAEASLADDSSAVLEIGPGLGCLTKELSALAHTVVAVELDKRLPAVLAESLSDCKNVEIINDDVLKTDIDALIDEKFGTLTPRVCANLPYNITTPVLTKLLSSRRFETVTVMIQREVARRLCAAPGTADYGAFTVFVNYYTEPELLFDVPPSCFIPQPKVTSTVVRMVCRKSPPAEIHSEDVFFRTVRASFAQRRKTLVNGLSAAFPEIGKDGLTAIIEDCGFDSRVRGETLSIGEFALLANKINSNLR